MGGMPVGHTTMTGPPRFSQLTTKLLFLLFLHLVSAQTTSDTCCEVQIVDGQGDVDGTYMLNSSPSAALEEVRLDSCIYTKIGDEPGREYCFKGTNLPGSVECSALPTESPVTGSTEAPSEESLQEDISNLDARIAQDEAEFQELQEQEAEAEELESGLDDVSTKIDELLEGGRRQKRQGEETSTPIAPASSCQEIAQLVEEMETETETKKRLKIVTKITTTTVISCTDENDKQFLIVKKEKIRNVLIQVKSETDEIKNEIRKEKTKVSLKIVKNKRKQEKLLEKLDIMLNPTTMPPSEPNVSETPITMAPSSSEETPIAMEPSSSEETLITMAPSSSEETPIAMTTPGLGETSSPGDVEGGEEPTSIGPGEGSGEVPITMGPEGSGEEPIPMKPGEGSGEEPRPMKPGEGSGEEPIPMKPGEGSGEEP